MNFQKKSCYSYHRSPASAMDFDKLEAELKSKMDRDDRYWRENDAKFRAAKQMASYEEFVDIVKVSSAHESLQRISDGLVKMPS